MKKLVMYGLVIAAIGVLVQLLDMFGMSLGLPSVAGISLGLIVLVLGAVVALYGYMKK